MYMYGLAALTVLLGLGITLRGAQGLRGPRRADAAATLIGGVLALALGTGIGFLARSTVASDQQRARNEAAALAATPAPEPQLAPVSSGEVEPPSSGSAALTARYEVQNLAAVAGRDATDPEITGLYARLAPLCPPEAASPADVVVNLQERVRQQTGRVFPVTDVMQGLISAQEGAAASAMTCSETAGLLATVMSGR